MARGKNICKTLKGIRQKIADANGISYAPRECHYQGDCLGTCPACEQEVRYLESELQKRRSMGFVNKVAGIAAGICALAMPLEMEAQTVTKPTKGTVPILKKDLPITDLSKGEADSVTVKGIVTDSLKEPCIGTLIRIKGTKKGVIADSNGQFAIKVAKDAELEFRFIAMKTQVIKVKDLKDPSYITVVLKDDNKDYSDQVIIAGGVTSSKITTTDDVYRHYTPKIKGKKKK
ncbi:MAG: carboxypeptidase-like regulatory domain-containing protein [Prevotella sp.]|jgi:hypothetical protein|nr:carboxypeptidase-like regulatory domain-containing protein [Prevotella sp.]MCI1281317.1 carboxypeptidase-like regulatory domain-containing protein [Prevotella sp.]